MSYEDKILSFLSEPENLPLAFEVAEYVEVLKDRAHESFWPLFEQNIAARLSSSSLVDTWAFEPFNMGKLRSDYEKAELYPLGQAADEGLRLHFIIGQGPRGSNYRFYIGVRWNPKGPDGFRSPALNKLDQSLASIGLSQTSNNWVRWGFLDPAARGQDFIIRMNQDPEMIVDELAESYWNMFIEYRQLAEQVMNEIVAKGT